MKIDSSVISGAYNTAITQEKEAVETDAFKKSLEKAASGKDLDKLKEASQEFESYFVNSLFKEMRKTIQDGGLVEKSEATTTFEEMLDEEMSKTISKKGGFGIAEMIYNNMLKVYSNTPTLEADSKSEVEATSESGSAGLDLKG